MSIDFSPEFWGRPEDEVAQDLAAKARAGGVRNQDGTAVTPEELLAIVRAVHNTMGLLPDGATRQGGGWRRLTVG